jgi:hypothetical protein
MPVSPALDFPNAAAVVIARLKPALAAAGRPVDVAGDVPAQRPVEFVRVSRTGGPLILSGTKDAAQLTFECWAATSSTAWSLARLCRRLVLNMAGTVAGGEHVHAVLEVGGPGSQPDPVSNAPRVVFTHQVQLSGHAA